MKKITWKDRSSNYDSLQWVKNNGLIDCLIRIIKPNPSDIVLDLGTGTGIVPSYLFPFVNEIIGIDISEAMIEKAKSKNIDKLKLINMDILKMTFPENSFDNITARMVFHHLLSKRNVKKALQNCYSALKVGGSVVVIEGIPPSDDLLEWFESMFKIKEDRISFKEKEIELLMKQVGFFPTETFIFKMKNMSIKNWLNNSGVIEENKEKIYKMHLELDDKWKKLYGMKISDSDIYCNFTFAIVKGIKPSKA